MDGVSVYQETAVLTQSRGKLIVMLYDGAIKFLRQAQQAISTGDYENKSLYLNKALDIINELNMSLDMESGGEISGNLRSLYGFMTSHLNQAGSKMDARMVQEVIDLLEELNQGWRAVAT